MTNKPYLVRVSSQKGGVGKTTVAVNLASALKVFGYSVLLVDFDFSNPTVGFHLGLEDTNAGLQSALMKKAKISNIVSIHEPTGLNVLSGEIKGWAKAPTPSSITSFLNTVKKTNYQYVLIDTSPGFDLEAGMRNVDEDIIITTPDIPSCASAVRLSTKYDRVHLKHTLVVNRAKGARYELSPREITDMYGGEVSGWLPYDEVVPASIAAHIPAVVFRPGARFSRAAKDNANRYASRSGTVSPKDIASQRYSFWEVFSRLFRRRSY